MKKVIDYIHGHKEHIRTYGVMYMMVIQTITLITTLVILL